MFFHSLPADFPPAMPGLDAENDSIVHDDAGEIECTVFLCKHILSFDR
jgi:hypothetical protein